MCDTDGCAMHHRNDLVDITNLFGEDFITKVNYLGEWVVLTTENPYHYQIALEAGKGLFFVTALVRVGKGAIGDLPDGLRGYVYEGSMTGTLQEALDAHDMLVTGVTSGLLTDLTETITFDDLICRYL